MAAKAAAAAIKAVPWTARSAVAVFILPWVVLPLVVAIWLIILSLAVPMLKPLMDRLSSDDPISAFVFVLIDFIGSFALIAYFLRKYGAKVSDLGIRGFSLGKMLLYLLLLAASFFALIVAANIIIQIIYPNFNPDQPQVNEFTKSPSALGLWALVILPPLVEETVFRGYMFPAFAKRHGLVVGAIISSLLFAIAHWQLNVSVYTFILGLLLCFLYTRLGSIIPGMALHMLNNYIAYMALNQK